MLFIHKHIPTNYEELDFNPLTTRLLKTFNKTDATNNTNIQNFIIYGPSGSGKKIRVKVLLKELYGKSVEKLQIAENILKSKKSVTYSYYYTSHHFEITPSNYLTNDKNIICEFIKTITQTRNISNNKEKIIVIHKADELSMLAQCALRRIMEISAKSARFIFIANNISKIIDAIKSRCLVIRNPSPSNTVISKILSRIAIKENIIPQTKNYIKEVMKNKDITNLNLAINNLQMSQISKSKIFQTKLEREINNILNIVNVKSNQSNKSNQIKLELFVNLKEIIYRLYVDGYNQTYIITELGKRIVKTFDINDSQKFEIVKICANYEYRIVNGNKPTIHIEAFLYNVMKIIF